MKCSICGKECDIITTTDGEYIQMVSECCLAEVINDLDELSNSKHSYTYEKTLRDEIAIAAMQGLITKKSIYESHGDIARKAYEQADVMLRKRDKK